MTNFTGNQPTQPNQPSHPMPPDEPQQGQQQYVVKSNTNVALIIGIVAAALIVLVAITGIIAAIAIPSLLRSRMSANEAAMIGSLKTLAAAQTDYNNNASPHTYIGELVCLGSGNGAGGVSFVDPALASGIKSGYEFAMERGHRDTNGSFWAWSATAWPVVYASTGIRTGYIDESGVIRAQDIGGGQGDHTLPAIE